MADYWDRFKQAILPDPAPAAQAIKGLNAPQAQPEPGPWQKTYSSLGDLAKGYGDVLKSGVEQLAGGGGDSSGASNAVVVTPHNVEPFAQSMVKVARGLPSDVPEAHVAPISFDVATAPRWATQGRKLTPGQPQREQIPISYHPYLNQGQTLGGFNPGTRSMQFAGSSLNPRINELIDIAQSRNLTPSEISEIYQLQANPMMEQDPLSVAHTRMHESTHAHQNAEHLVQLGKIRIPMSQRGGISNELYQAAGDVAGSFPLYKGESMYPQNPANLESFVNNLKAQGRLPREVESAWDLYRAAGYSPEKIHGMLKYFKEFPEDYYTGAGSVGNRYKAKLAGDPDTNIEYVGNPLEMEARRVGQKMRGRYEQFMQDYPTLSGGKSWQSLVDRLLEHRRP